MDEKNRKLFGYFGSPLILRRPDTSVNNLGGLDTRLQPEETAVPHQLEVKGIKSRRKITDARKVSRIATAVRFYLITNKNKSYRRQFLFTFPLNPVNLRSIPVRKIMRKPSSDENVNCPKNGAILSVSNFLHLSEISKVGVVIWHETLY